MRKYHIKNGGELSHSSPPFSYRRRLFEGVFFFIIGFFNLQIVWWSKCVRRSFFRAEFQKEVGLDFQYSSNIKEQFQREAAIHVGSFDGSKVLSADAELLRQLFLGIAPQPPIIANGVV